jgi:hypothetical protein
LTTVDSEATLFYHSDSLSYSRERKNLSHQPVVLDMASRHELADLIRTYFHHTEGRGKNCVVELFRRGEMDYFFAYPCSCRMVEPSPRKSMAAH